MCTQQQLKDLEVKIIHICQYVFSTNNCTVKKMTTMTLSFRNGSTIALSFYTEHPTVMKIHIVNNKCHN